MSTESQATERELTAERDGENQFSKTIDFKATDDERQVATGAVLVPDKVDAQGDYLRESTIRDFAEGFMQNLPDGDSEGGIMHTVFPGEDVVALVENRVLDDAQTIGGNRYPAGTWIQSWKFGDGQLWELVKDEILAGYSIGGKVPLDQTEWFEQRSEVPGDVEIPADLDLPDDLAIREIKGGTIHEVSSVDVPAVPDAEIASLKAAALEKASPALVESQSTCETYLTDRGHEEDEAKRLCTFIQRHSPDDSDKTQTQTTETMESDDSGEESTDEKTETDVEKETADEDADDGAREETTSPTKGLLAKVRSAVPGMSSSDAEASEKAGRTLSESNVRAVKNIHDSALALLATEGVETGERRTFTDDSDDSFDLAEYGSKNSAATTGEINDDSNSMSSQSEGAEKSLPEQNAESIADLTESVKTLTDYLEELDSDEKSSTETETETEGDGDGEEKTQAEKNAEQIATLAETVDDVGKSVEAIAEAGGLSKQVDDSDSNSAQNGEFSKADFLGLPKTGGN